MSRMLPEVQTLSEGMRTLSERIGILAKEVATLALEIRSFNRTLMWTIPVVMGIGIAAVGILVAIG